MYIASEWTDDYRNEFEFLRQNPDVLIEELAYCGVLVTELDIEFWTWEDYFHARVTSPFVKEQFKHGIVVKKCDINGDIATITFVRQGSDYQAVLIRELAMWKVTNRAAD